MAKMSPKNPNPLPVTTALPEEISQRMRELTRRERLYFMCMWPKSGVLYITSKPGIAKSAIARSIADKMNFQYMDLRLSMSDETDFKFPYLKEVDIDGVSRKCHGYSTPEWALKANSQPTIIHFEELNRAPQFVRNAALQILLEREIGDFKFNSNVLMMASGNLGDEDGTDVEEFDNALNNRLIHMSHSLSANDWQTDFASKWVHPLIISYLKAYPDKLYQNPTENTKAYATPRSWTFLSDFIVQNFGKESSVNMFIDYLREVSHSYVGNGAQRFLQYCEEMMSVSIRDVLNRYDEVSEILDKYNRDKNSELVQSLKEPEFAVGNLSDKQLTNLTKFLKRLGDDELTAYLLWILDDPTDQISNPKVKKFLSAFKDVLLNIQRINKPPTTTESKVKM
jgi:hypothetical protein